MRILTCLMMMILIACGGSDGGGDVDRGLVADTAVALDAGPPDGAVVAPEIALSPLRLTLAAEAGQRSDPVPLLIQNQGAGPLVITSIALEPPVPAITSDAPAFPLTIAPNDSLTVNYTFTPVDSEELNTQIVVKSDDADEPELLVGVVARVAERCIRASPTELNLGSVNPGTRTGRFVLSLNNCGDLPLTLTQVQLDGPEQFVWGSVNDRPLDGAVLAPGSPLRLEFVYVNDIGLAPGDSAVATLIVDSDAANAPRVEVPIRAMGGDGPSCIIQLTPERLEFDTLRIGRTATLQATVANNGSAQCELEAVRVDKTRGSEENLFAIEVGIEDRILPAGSEYEITVSFSPEVANPIGDQATLFVEYRDPHIMQNRRAQAFVTGVGSEALIGSDPQSGLNFRSIVAPTCASTDMPIRAANVGFVPLCVASFALEGDCDQFAFIAEPDLAECALLAEDEFVEWTVRYQPDEEAEHDCDILVTSDAMNADVLRIPLQGTGVAEPGRRERVIVGPLNPNLPATFGLRQVPVPETIQVTHDGQPDVAWSYDALRNEIVYRQADHPARGDELLIDYDVFCFDRAE